MQDKYLLELTLSGHVEKRDDGQWVSYNHEFGFITYGRTRTSAIQEALNAFDMVLDVYRKDGDMRKLERWLKRRGVQYTLAKLPRTKALYRGSHTQPRLSPLGQIQTYRSIARRPLQLAA